MSLKSVRINDCMYVKSFQMHYNKVVLGCVSFQN